MTTTSESKEREAFQTALDLQGKERAAYLDEVQAKDPDLATRVLRLLAAHERAEATPTGPLLGDGQAPSADAAPLGGTTIGGYRILESIAVSGMGEVFEAEQEQPRRRVALKIIRAGLANESLLRRFEHEVHVLGRLQHRNIAQIFDAGVADTARGKVPFFALELVRGATLLEHAAAKDLDTRARLALLAEIADAVDHAHQQGVVHRDLKPANILVDESGRPKVLDFGVARITDPDVQLTTIQTMVGQLVGTLPYMSPEQVRADPAEIDARSDVYALGVVGYELLTGQLPHDVSDKSVPEAARVIGEDAPTRLGTVVRTLRGDVDTMIGKALEKERLRRYATASDFAADIRRFLRDEPIHARPTGVFYQFRKFAQRRRALVLGIAVAFLGLVGGSIFAIVKAVDANRARAREWANFNFYLTRTMWFANPENTIGTAKTIGEFLDLAEEQMQRAFRGEPDQRLQMYTILAVTNKNRARYDAAERVLGKYLETSSETHGESSRQTAFGLYQLGQVRVRRGQVGEGQALLERALAICRSVPADDQEDIRPAGIEDEGCLLCDLGVARRLLGDLVAAERLQREALSWMTAEKGNEIVRAILRFELGITRRLQGDLDDAETLTQDALMHLRAQMVERRERHEKWRTLSVDAYLARALENLAAIAALRGNWESAGEHAREVVRLRTGLYIETHPDLVRARAELARIVARRR